MRVKTWRNGTPIAGVRFDPAHSALLQGDGLFETIRVRRGIPLYLNRHLDRLVQSAARSGYPWMALHDQLDGPMHEPLRAAQLMRSGALRIYVYPSMHDEGPEVFATLEDYEPPPESEYWRGVRYHVSPVAHPGHGRYGKTTSRHWAETARRLSRQAGYKGAVLLDAHRHVVESTDASLLWSAGGVWYAASAELGGLEGTTLEEMQMRGLQVTQTTAEIDDLKKAEAVVAISSLRIAMGVRSIDDVEFENPDVNAMMLRALILD
jgi:branched-subunit amino acid aminotransferase/4-amino-4-deoxychorismate lyase